MSKLDDIVAAWDHGVEQGHLDPGDLFNQIHEYCIKLEKKLEKASKPNLKDLPEEFYEKFIERQVKETGGSLLGNTEAQYYFSRGFYATLDILNEIYE